MILGTVKYNSGDGAFGPMGYKYQELDQDAIKKALEKTPNCLLKTKPHVNGRDDSICQLDKYHVKDVTVK
ncbi:acetoacetate decarboxylase, partial [Francisella tularensis subsp. holarctica]|uniref:acetoacetate decarboxylase family protein n=1 Tax=Francisella tularensis TaxID=263 RepID=UPI0023AD271C|nr:acetoacetate decarboxylase [Francisella tularensis subsp. holarctica]